MTPEERQARVEKLIEDLTSLREARRATEKIASDCRVAISELKEEIDDVRRELLFLSYGGGA